MDVVWLVTRELIGLKKGSSEEKKVFVVISGRIGKI